MEERALLERHLPSTITSRIPLPVKSHGPGRRPAGRSRRRLPMNLSPAEIRGAYGISQLPADRERAGPDHRHRRRLRRSALLGAGRLSPSDLHKFDPIRPGRPAQLRQAQPERRLDDAGNTPARAGESLDVEWAHAIAPQANIILFEATSTSTSDLMTAVQTAAELPRRVRGFDELERKRIRSRLSATTRTSPRPAATGVTFLAATGDSGEPGEYPAYSPNVVAVGGTSLTINRHRC